MTGRKAWIYMQQVHSIAEGGIVDREHITLGEGFAMVGSHKHSQQEGVFLTIQQRDDLIAESEARGAGAAMERVNADLADIGGLGTLDGDVFTDRTEAIGHILLANMTAATQAYTDKIRLEGRAQGVEEAAKLLESDPEYGTAEYNMSVMQGELGAKIRALKP